MKKVMIELTIKVPDNTYWNSRPSLGDIELDVIEALTYYYNMIEHSTDVESLVVTEKR